jgi:hypothetical protein
MHHQMQQFGDLGLERLGLDLRSGIGGHDAGTRYKGFVGSKVRWMSGPGEPENPDIARLFRVASLATVIPAH